MEKGDFCQDCSVSLRDSPVLFGIYLRYPFQMLCTEWIEGLCPQKQGDCVDGGVNNAYGEPDTHGSRYNILLRTVPDTRNICGYLYKTLFQKEKERIKINPRFTEKVNLGFI